MCNLLLGLSFKDYLCSDIRLDCPVLLLWGDEDTILCPRDESVMMDNMPYGRGYWIEGGSHMLVGDAVITVTGLMEAFLAEGTKSPISASSPGLVERLMRSSLAFTKKTFRPMLAPHGKGMEGDLNARAAAAASKL